MCIIRKHIKTVMNPFRIKKRIGKRLLVAIIFQRIVSNQEKLAGLSTHPKQNPRFHATFSTNAHILPGVENH